MKRIGLIALALVLSLGLMGAGLAYWNETLTIGGSVATGTYDVEFLNVDTNDDGDLVPSTDTGADPVKSPSTNPLGLDVASCTALPSGPTTDPGGEGVDTGEDVITVEILKGYPCYNPVIDFDIHNCGTIPAKIESITITTAGAIDQTAGGTDGTITTAGEYVDIDLDNDGKTDIRVTVSHISVGDALAVCVDVPGDLDIHVWAFENEGGDATENASGSFTVTIETIQFNG